MSSVISFLVPIVLLLGGAYMSARLKFFHVTKTHLIAKSILCDRGGTSGRSPFKEVTVALAGTLGVGNLMGVAAAIALGGPGSIFWMWVGALLSMILKYAEIVLAVKFRIEKDGSRVGGAMYYLRKPFFRVAFAALCVCTSFTLGNIIQIRAVSQCFEYVYKVPPIVCGYILAVTIFLIIINGHKGVSRFTSIVIPVAATAYIAASLYVIFTNLTYIPAIFGEIFTSAFSLPAAVGGGLGSLILAIRPIRYGVIRGLITNEAGCGTAPIAHAASDASRSVTQGFWGIFEVFVDTILLCTLSALVILIARPDLTLGNDMKAVLFSFEKYLGATGDHVIAICVLLFAVAGVVGWFYYGLIGLKYLTDGKRCGAPLRRIYAILYALCVIFGSVCTASLAWDLTDVTIGLMALINTPCILSYSRLVSKETEDFFLGEKMKKKETCASIR